MVAFSLILALLSQQLFKLKLQFNFYFKNDEKRSWQLLEAGSPDPFIQPLRPHFSRPAGQRGDSTITQNPKMSEMFSNMFSFSFVATRLLKVIQPLGHLT